MHLHRADRAKLLAGRQLHAPICIHRRLAQHWNKFGAALTAKEEAASSQPLLCPRHRQQVWACAASAATISARCPRVCPSNAAVVYRLPRK